MKKITIGADPEFMIFINNMPLPACVLCDDRILSNHFGRDTGQDGYVFELRPDPSTDVFAVLANIRKILQVHIQEFPYLKKCVFIGGHTVSVVSQNYFAIGGHVHISAGNYEDTHDLNTNIFKDFLDKIICSGFMYLIDDRENHIIRKRKNYGKPKSFAYLRNSILTLEYRTPPSWLVNPTLAFMFLALAKICGLLFVNRKIWDTSQKIYNISLEKGRGLNLLKKFIAIVEINEELMRGEDVAKCVEILNNLSDRHTRRVNILWNRDFKSFWRL